MKYRIETSIIIKFIIDIIFSITKVSFSIIYIFICYKYI